MSEKQTKIFKILIIILAIILVVELIYFGIRYYNNRQKYVFYNVENSTIIDKDTRISAGFTDYRYSKFNDFEDGYSKPTISVYKGNKKVKEVGLKLGYHGYYYDIVKVKDGYIAVGAIEMTKEQNQDGLTEGIIVKYDKNFKQLWRKNVSVLGKTEFLKVKTDKNNIIVVGTGVYGEGYVGNHTTGGGILVIFDQKGNKKKIINNGGPYSGKFNDILIEKDGYVVVGLGKKNSGIIIKYDKKGKKIWSSSYGYTDESGMLAIDKIKDNYVVATTKMVSPTKTSNYVASLLIYDKKGNKIDEVKYSSNNITYFTDVKVDKDNNIYACGITGKLKNNSINSDAVIVKYDKDLYQQNESILKGENNDYFIQILLKNKKVQVLGYSNSKIKEYKTNGYDYSPFIKEYKNNLK